MRRFVVVPSSFSDANDWVVGQTGFGSEAATGDRTGDGSSFAPRIYHAETRLPNGKPALLLDIGSVGNLAGDEWVRLQAAAALRAGLRPAQRRRERPLTVRGVGQGGEKCTYNCILPVTLLHSVGRSVTGTFDAPTVPRSQLPALLGLNAARESRMIIDMTQSLFFGRSRGLQPDASTSPRHPTVQLHLGSRWTHADSLCRVSSGTGCIQQRCAEIDARACLASGYHS